MGVRLNLTNDEKQTQKLTGLESDALRFNVGTDKDINRLEKSWKRFANTRARLITSPFLYT